MTSHSCRVLFVPLLLAAATAAVAASETAPSAASPRSASGRHDFAVHWGAQGLAPMGSARQDLVYVRPGSIAAPGPALQIAPVTVEMHRDWQRTQTDFSRDRPRPEDTQRIKDEVARIVADELRKELASAPAAVAGDGGAGGPVLEARVLDLYLNAPELQTAVSTRSYTSSFGDLVLVAELRDRPGGTLLLGSWEHPLAREFSELRLTTRVENAIEVRNVARAWAKDLRRDLDRLAAGH